MSGWGGSGERFLLVPHEQPSLANAREAEHVLGRFRSDDSADIRQLIKDDGRNGGAVHADLCLVYRDRGARGDIADAALGEPIMDTELDLGDLIYLRHGFFC